LIDADAAAGYMKYAEGAPMSKSLHWFHSWSAGIDKEPIELVLNRGGIVTSSKSNGAIPISEHTLMAMLMVTRKATNWIDAQRQHKWARQKSPELYGKTLGLIGLGNIGTEIARRAAAFGMRLLAVRRQSNIVPDVPIERIVGPEGLLGVLTESDYIVVTVPLTPATRGMIGEKEFRAMKPTAFYFSSSRGAVADPTALERALREGWIAGAGLDTHAEEPLSPDSPFWDMPNTLVTPHNGGTTQGTSDRAVDVLVDNLNRWGRSEPLRNIVDLNTRY